jgi:hypothetical protein
MAQHAQQKKHKAKLPAYLKKGDKQAFIEATIEAHQATNQLRGRTLDPDVKMIRFKFVRACLESNTPLGSANPMAELVEECSKMSVGDVPHCGAEFLSVIHELEVHKIRQVNKTSFPQWSITPDGTPSCCEFEGMCLRKVTEDWEIIDFLVLLRALKKSPNSQVLARAWEACLLDRCQLALKDGRAVMFDRAAVNHASVTVMKERNAALALFEAGCSPHTMVKVGDKFDHAELSKVLSKWVTAIMHPGNARLRFQEVLGEAPKKGGGIRWWTKWEVISQLERLDIEKFSVLVVDFCVAGGYSEASCGKLQTMLKDPAVLSKVIVQFAAQADAGRPFCQTTYWLEGDAPLIFLALDLMHYLDEELARGIELPKMEKAAVRAAEIMAPEAAKFEAAIVAAKALVASATKESVTAKKKVKDLEAAKAQGGGVRRGGRARNVTAKGAGYFVGDVGGDGDGGGGGGDSEGGDGGGEDSGEGGDGDGGGEEALRMAEYKAQVKSTAAQLVGAIAEQAAAETAKEEWKKAVVCVTKEEFMEMGAAGLQPGYNYYTEIYNNPGGKLYELKRTYQGATVFNPLKIMSMEESEVCLL